MLVFFVCVCVCVLTFFRIYFIQIIVSAGACIVSCGDGIGFKVLHGVTEESVKLDVLVAHDVRVGCDAFLVPPHHVTEANVLVL